MTPTERNGGRRVVLHGRDGLPTPAARQRERLTDRLAVLEREGDVDEFATERWDKRVRLDATRRRPAEPSTATSSSRGGRASTA